ncbi:axial budding pattern protein 2 [Microdochium nivale]|nr:axial budding pattern protein 2 [Microdochium nivale]
MSGCPPLGFASPTVATIVVAGRDMLNLTHIIPMPESATHVHYQAFVNQMGDDGDFTSLHPPMINNTLEWDAKGPFSVLSPPDVSALPAWLPLGGGCPRTTAIYHIWPVPEIITVGRVAASNYIVADWYYHLQSDNGPPTSGPNQLWSSTFIVLKPEAPPPPPSASSNPNTAALPTPSSSDTTGTTPTGKAESGSASASSGAGATTEGPTSQDSGIGADAALALKIVMPILAVGLVLAGWVWWRRRKSQGNAMGLFRRRVTEDADGAAVAPDTSRFEKAELQGNPVAVTTTAQPGELEGWPAARVASEQNNQQVDGFERTVRPDRGRVMSFELEAPLHSGGKVAQV